MCVSAWAGVAGRVQGGWWSWVEAAPAPRAAPQPSSPPLLPTARAPPTPPAGPQSSSPAGAGAHIVNNRAGSIGCPDLGGSTSSWAKPEEWAQVAGRLGGEGQGLRRRAPQYTQVSKWTLGCVTSERRAPWPPGPGPLGTCVPFYLSSPGWEWSSIWIPDTWPVMIPGTWPVMIPGTWPVRIPGTWPVMIPGTWNEASGPHTWRSLGDWCEFQRRMRRSGEGGEVAGGGAHPHALARGGMWGELGLCAGCQGNRNRGYPYGKHSCVKRRKKICTQVIRQTYLF